MLTVMVDSDSFDVLVADEADRRLVVTAVSAGALELLTTHIQEDQMANTKDAAKRWRQKSIPRRIVNSSVFVLDVSRLDAAAPGGGATYDKLRGTKDVHDAIIGDTAHAGATVLVTEDRRFTNHARTVGLTVWKGHAVIAFARGFAAGAAQADTT